MFKSPKSTFALALAVFLASGVSYAQEYNIGASASAQEIAGWDIDIRPDGMGLPVGSGNAVDGEETYETFCASCHGVFGEG